MGRRRRSNAKAMATRKRSNAPRQAEAQVTKYKYDSHGDLESITNPLEQTWKYGYGSYGDRTAETDPEGDKRTWEYNADSQRLPPSPPGERQRWGTDQVHHDDRTQRAGAPAEGERTKRDRRGPPSNKVEVARSPGRHRQNRHSAPGAGILGRTTDGSYTYQWQHCNSSGGSCANVSGAATSSTYLLGGGDVGDTLRIVVTATNSAGSTSSTSEATAIVSGHCRVRISIRSKGPGGGQFESPRL